MEKIKVKLSNDSHTPYWLSPHNVFAVHYGYLRLCKQKQTAQAFYSSLVTLKILMQPGAPAGAPHLWMASGPECMMQ